ncbi:MAG: pentapeptide repeat-containing protein, partial [Alphaproteobacteria bacterium]
PRLINLPHCRPYRGANFTDAALTNTDLRGAKLDGSTMTRQLRPYSIPAYESLILAEVRPEHRRDTDGTLANFQSVGH